ncbi:MAG: hypothetical protein HY661_08770 [Betaproteobacteria bacterium]|nr:hypothetical protein [Betaproteobacteria bacterium]
MNNRPCNRWCSLVIAFAAMAAVNAEAQTAAAEFSRQVWLSPGIYARHFNRDKNLRDGNPGLGVEVALARDHALMAGTFINSNDARTRYGAYEWRPLHWQWGGVDVGAGIIVSAFDGYPNYRNGGWFLAPLPVVSFEGKRFGVNLSVIPTLENRLDGAVAVQFKLRVW